VHSGLRAIGYATRMLLPLFITCDTLDFSHSVGSANSPWSAVFIYERYPLGLGFTEQAYERMHEILPAVLDTIRQCPCEAGCPCCVGKPLRGYTTWNVERGEASIPSKAAAQMILELLGDGSALRPLQRLTKGGATATEATCAGDWVDARAGVAPSHRAEPQTEYPQPERGRTRHSRCSRAPSAAGFNALRKASPRLPEEVCVRSPTGLPAAGMSRQAELAATAFLGWSPPPSFGAQGGAGGAASRSGK
jgi:hypothetical protein